MLNIQDFKNLILVPTLKAVGLYSESAVNLLLGTALQESRLTYLQQKGGGPALGLFQIEPTTLNDMYIRYLGRDDKQELDAKIKKFMTAQNVHEQVISNLPFATLMARVRYLMVPEVLPAHDDLEGLAGYWKKYYNTSSGAGTVEEFIENYNLYVLGIRLDDD